MATRCGPEVGEERDVEGSELHLAAAAACGDPMMIIDGIIEFVGMAWERMACRLRKRALLKRVRDERVTAWRRRVLCLFH